MATTMVFQALDCDGVAHVYVSTPIPVDLAWPMYVQAMQFGEAAGQAFDALKMSGVMLDATEVMTEEARRSAIFAIDGTRAGKALASLGVALGKDGALPFIKQLLWKTTRDGKSLVDTANFNAAFDGNVVELQEAFVQVLKHNFGVAFTRPLEQLGSLLPETQSAHPTSTGASEGKPSV